MKKIFVAGVLLVGILTLSGFAFQDKPEFLKNPAKVVVWLLDFKLDLSDAQEKDIRGILEPVFSEIRTEHQKLLSDSDEILNKIKSGKLEKSDIVSRMEKRREFRAAHQDKVADSILKVYKVFTDQQRETIAGIIKGHLDRIKN